MTKRTPGEVFAQLRAAGFSILGAVTETAIAGAESGFDDAAVGDTKLEDATWGPSYGLYQIRTTKKATGTGGPRDISALAGDDAAQAKAAYSISREGTDFTPWSAYTNGSWQRFLGTAQAAAGTTTPVATPVSSGGSWWDYAGPLPYLFGKGLSDTQKSTTAQLYGLATEGLFVLLGLGLIYAGARVMAQPTVKAKEQEAAKVAKAAVAVV